jgi:hypothetical protein
MIFTWAYSQPFAKRFERDDAQGQEITDVIQQPRGAWKLGELKMSRVKRLTEALLADRHRGETERTDITKCFMCGFGMLYRGSSFCSDRCRDFYDAGEPGHEQNWLHGPKTESLPLTNLKVIAGPPSIEIGSFYHHLGDLPATPTKCTVAGYMVRCTGCGKKFESRGLRCCSGDCWRRYKQRQENLALMAEAGIEPLPKKLCATCGGKIPTWRNGRRVSKATRFCSPKCARAGRS